MAENRRQLARSAAPRGQLMADTGRWGEGYFRAVGLRLTDAENCADRPKYTA